MVNPNLLNQPFEEQLQYFANKYAIPVETLKGVPSEFHDFIFAVSRLMKSDFVQYLHQKILDGMKQGKGYQEVIDEMKTESKGKEITQNFTNKHLITVLDTNYRRSHSAARKQQMEKPHVLAIFPYKMWIHRDSPHPRHHHRALHRKVFLANDPFWDKAFPPCGFGCRCGAIAVTEDQVQRQGLKVEDPPDWQTIVDKGFESAAGSAAKKDQQKIIQKGIERQSPAMQRLIKKELNK